MPMIMKNCEYCNEPFEAKRTTARYDTDACRKAAARTPEGPAAESSSPELPDNSVKSAPKKKINSEAKASNNKLGGNTPQTPPRLNTTHAELLARMNERLQAKGLPLLQEEVPPTEFVRTGIREIDELTASYDALGWGGFPRKHISEVFGTKGAGKTSLMKQIIAFNPELKVLYFDVENGMTNPPANIHISKSTLLENIEAISVEAVDSDAYDLIVVDSVAMMSSEREKSADKAAMMEKAKAMAQFVRRINAYLRDDSKVATEGGTAIVFINQLRDTGNSFGVKEFTPGGRSLEYGASLRLELRSAKADKIIKAGATVGQRVRVKIEKSRFNGEDVGTTVVFPLMFGDL